MRSVRDSRGASRMSGGGISLRVVMSNQQGVSRVLKPRARLLGRVALGAAIAFGLLGTLPADARNGRGHAAVAQAESGPVFEWILLDAETGQVLSEQNADVLTYPASLTKMMTLYLTFEALNQGRISLDQSFYVSPFA